MRILKLFSLLFFATVLSLSASGQTYCTSNATSTADTYIESVSFANISFTGNLTSCVTYTDNTSLIANVFQGMTYTLSVKTGDCTPSFVYTHETRAYIDWNNDGDFLDPGEEVLTKAPRSAASTEIRQITIPTNAAIGQTRMRVVATEGFASACGTYSWGETEDYTIDIRRQPEFDANVGTVAANAIGMRGYVQIPFVQAPNYEFTASVSSGGFDTITGVTLNASIPGTAYSQAINVGTLIPGDDTTVTTWNTFTPTAQGDYGFQVVASINENDTVPDNDTSVFNFSVSDTVLSRDDSSITGGLGFNTGSGILGHVIDVVSPDTITSATFYLSSPNLGASTRVIVYESDTAPSNGGFPYGNSGEYFNPVDSSRVLVITSTDADWYTLLIGCEDGLAVSPGKYLLGVEQVNPSNMSLGYTLSLPSDTATTYFIGAQDSSWTDLKTSTSNVADAIYLLRANFGLKAVRDLVPDTAYYCNSSSTFLKTGGSWANFQWSTGSLQDSIQVSSSTVYNVTVTDDNNCSFIDSVQVLERDPIQYSASVTDASCGASDGMVIATASGTQAPYSYHWATGDMGDTIMNIAGGTYDVTVTDAYNCSKSFSSLVLGKNPVLNGVYTPPTCNGDADGVAKVDVTEGIPSYTYSWQGGGSVSDELTGLSAGSYSVTVTDSSNCFTAITIDVVNPDSLILSTANSSNPSNCGANDGVANVSVTGGMAPYSYFWSDGQNQNNAINLSTGTYDVTVTDSLGCVRTSTVDLIDPNAPSIAGVSSTVTCSEDLGSVAVTVTGGTAPYVYNWNNNSSDSSQTGLPVGVYTVNVVDAAGCIKVASAEVQGPDQMDVDFQVTYGPAGDGDTDIDAVITGANTPYANYQWRSIQGINSTTIAGATTSTLNDALNGNYRIVVEDAQGCLDSADVEINNLSVGVVDLNDDHKLSVYPNPSAGDVYVSIKDYSGDLNVKLTDAQGKVLNINKYTYNAGDEISVDLSGQAVGIYFLEISGKDMISTHKIQLLR